MKLLSVLLLLFTLSSAFAQYCDLCPYPPPYSPEPQVYYPAPQVYYPAPQVYYPGPYVYSDPYRYKRELRRRKRCVFYCGPFGGG